MDTNRHEYMTTKKSIELLVTSGIARVGQEDRLTPSQRVVRFCDVFLNLQTETTQQLDQRQTRFATPAGAGFVVEKPSLESRATLLLGFPKTIDFTDYCHRSRN